MKSLKLALLGNAVFSAINGLLATVFTQTLAEMLLTQHVSILRVFGFSLLLHAIILFYVQRLPSRAAWTKINLSVIVPYPFLVGMLVVFGHISGRTGVSLAIFDALVIGLFAIWQYLSLRQLSRT